jgi:hypothetical protein
LRYPRHAGQYSSKRYADDYKKVLRKNGEIAEVVPRTVYDVVVVGAIKREEIKGNTQQELNNSCPPSLIHLMEMGRKYGGFPYLKDIEDD